jgi:hypothetical protein
MNRERRFKERPKKCQDFSFNDFLNREFETRSLPRSLAAARRGFTFYVADPLSSIDE